MYQEVAPGQLEDDPVGRNIKHMSGMKQTTGEAIYIDDMPKLHSKLMKITYDNNNIYIYVTRGVAEGNSILRGMIFLLLLTNPCVIYFITPNKNTEMI
jgi:xanthine dehydrogenase molybdopterin-binding subunit B